MTKQIFSFKVYLRQEITTFLAAAMLIFMLSIAFFSVKNDSLTMDELPHIPAGYSYVSQKDMRLNPEHPPLIKDMAGIPLLFIKEIRFPAEISSWTGKTNDQWSFGSDFLFRVGNPTEKIIFWARVPMLLILLILGIYIFKWAKELFGNKAALLALFLFSFSPTIITHGRLVTTDVGAAAGIFIATYYFIKFLHDGSRKNLIISGITLGIAELIKFSTFLLLPFFGILIFCLAIIRAKDFKSFLKGFLSLGIKLIAIIAISYLVIITVYQFHVWNYPPERQVVDSAFSLASYSFRFLADPVIWMADKPLTRALGQYLLGFLMVTQRATGGNTTYFMGEVSNLGWKAYFPTVYLLKEPLSFHILSLFALICTISALIRRTITKPLWKNSYPRLKEWLAEHFAEFAMLVFIFIYWTSSLTSNLNIGVRHLIPVLPLTMVLVAGIVAKTLTPPYLKLKYAFLGILIAWQAFSVINVYPHFLAYFNELAGGPNNGYTYAVDSNLDWGQDLKRLRMWIDENKIDKIYIDYFGGGDLKYYLGDKYEGWWGTRDQNDLPPGGYLAVSATFLQAGKGKVIPGFEQPSGFYLWLNNYEPVAKIGYSIFIYRID
ncbi:MAG: glycosyltransferase family 39 protein [bacterium]